VPLYAGWHPLCFCLPLCGTQPKKRMIVDGRSVLMNEFLLLAVVMIYFAICYSGV
jgi:hypothetical protein